MNSITVKDFKKILQPGISIIDIREKTKYDLGHIKYAINITKNELMFNTDKYLIKDKIYYIYCDKGIISKGLVNYLDVKGYKVVNIIGGYQSYKSDI